MYMCIVAINLEVELNSRKMGYSFQTLQLQLSVALYSSSFWHGMVQLSYIHKGLVALVIINLALNPI